MRGDARLRLVDRQTVAATRRRLELAQQRSIDRTTFGSVPVGVAEAAVPQNVLIAWSLASVASHALPLAVANSGTVPVVCAG